MVEESGGAVMPITGMASGLLAATGFGSRGFIVAAAVCLLTGAACLAFRFATRHRRLSAD